MSKRFLDKVKEVSKSINKPFAKRQNPSINNGNNFKNQEKQQWKSLSEKMNSISEKAKKIQNYLGDSYTNRWQTVQRQFNKKVSNKNKSEQNQQKSSISKMFEKGFKKVIGQQSNKQFLKKKLEEIKSNTGKVSHQSYEKLKDVGKTLVDQKQKVSQFGKKKAEDISQQAQKLKNQTLKKLTSTTEGKIDFVTKLMNKIFWKIALLLGLGLFAYGFGTSIPRQIRLHLSQTKESNSNEKKEQQKQISIVSK